MTTIPCATCTLRPWRAEDREALIWHADDLRIAENIRDFPEPFTFVEADAWLERCIPQSPCFDFAIEVDGEAVGGVSLRLGVDEGTSAWLGEITFWLGSKYRRRGIATDAVRAATFYALERFDAVRVYALVIAPNPAGVRVLEKSEYTLLGQVPEGIRHRGRIVDAMIYGYDREAFDVEA
ncbi:MAG: GNAT family protein [Dehalococcoidia bacterium]